MNYITVLDFEARSVFQYEMKELHLNKDEVIDHEEFLTNKGHNMQNCEWMVHENPQIITNWIRIKMDNINVTNK